MAAVTSLLLDFLGTEVSPLSLEGLGAAVMVSIRTGANTGELGTENPPFHRLLINIR